MEPFLTIRPLCGFAAADPTVPRRLSDFLARKRHAQALSSQRFQASLRECMRWWIVPALNASRMEGFRGRLSHWKIHGTLWWRGGGRGIHTMASKVQETAANQRSSLLGSSANYVVWIQGKGVKSRSTSFFPCLSQYPWKFARRRKKKNFISFLFVRLSKSMRWSFW